jgi:alkylation response protein AidB-like acyl-CoA dehydrogenase
MDFKLSDDQLLIQAAAREFAQNEIVPVAAEHDASGEFPHATIRKAGELGFMGIEVPVEYGGSGLDPVSFVVVMEEIAAADGAHATIISVNNSLYCNGIMEFGTDEQRRKFVQPVAAGKAVGCYGLSEPQSGSDAVGMRTRATLAPDGRHYIVNGKKSWITSGPVADFMLLFAMTDPSRKGKGISAFVLDTSKPGYLRGKTEPKLGIRASATCEVEFSDYQLPVANRLGAEGQGFQIAMTVLDQGRIGIAAQAVGMARAAFDAAHAYANDREAFGTKIVNHQAIQFRLADMATKIAVARQMILHAATLRDAGRPCLTEAAMAKLYASEMAEEVCSAAIQIHGGYGYVSDYLVEKIWRDVRVCQIYEGTSDVQRILIGRGLSAL